MVHPVHLFQFPINGSPFPHLIDFQLPSFLRVPQPFGHHLPHALVRDLHSLHLHHLFTCQRRPKPFVLPLQEIQYFSLGFFCQLMAARLPALFRDQAAGPLLPVSVHQPLHLPLADPKQFGRRFSCHPLLLYSLDHFQSVHFFRAHRYQVHFYVPFAGDITTLG